MDSSGEVVHDEESEQIIEDIEEGITYGGLEEEYGEFLTFMAASGPDSLIKEEDETVYFGEFSLAAASDIDERYFQSVGLDKKDAAAMAGGAAAGLGMAYKFFREEDPAWLASSLVTANIVKEPVKRVYNDAKAYRERVKDREEGLENFKEDFEEIESYGTEISDEEITAQAMESIGVEGMDSLSDKDLDSGMAFQ